MLATGETFGDQTKNNVNDSSLDRNELGIAELIFFALAAIFFEECTGNTGKCCNFAAGFVYIAQNPRLICSISRSNYHLEKRF